MPTYNVSISSSRARKIIGIIIIITALIFATVGFFIAKDSEATKNWPKAEADASGVTTKRESSGSGSSRSSYDVYNYTLNYTVDGKKYTSSSNSRERVNNGQMITVRYNPAAPSDARVGESKPWVSWIFYGVAAVEIIIGAAMLYTARRTSL